MTGSPRRGTRARRLGAAVAAGVLAVTLSGCGDRLLDGRDPAPVPTAAPTTSAPVLVPTPTPTTTATPTPTPSWTVIPKETESPVEAPTQAPTETPTPTQTRTSLRYGDRGERVLQLQQRLSDLGYWLGTPDGHFGGLTQQAVFAIQKAAGIQRDGVVGPRTRAALESGVRPSPRAGGTGAEIDLDRQLLLIVRDGRVVRILNTSTGNGQPYVSRGTEKIARTPRGSFAVYHQYDGTEDAELGILYRPKYFYRGYAIHGSPSIPPYPASHGCARVSNSAMNMLWASGYLSMGTPVTVYR